MAERKRKGQDREEEQGKVNAPAGPNLYPIDIGLDGKLITSIDPVQGAGVNFQTLKNLRYTPNGIKGILGMSKINTTALSSYPKIRSGIHFRKDTPAESHVLVQAYNSGETEMRVYQNVTPIPDQGDFSSTTLWADTIGSYDTYTSLMLHFNENFLDSAKNEHFIERGGGVSINTTIKKFGAGSASFDGDDDWLRTPAHADFDFSGGVWTVDCWVRLNALGNRYLIYGQGTSTNDWMECSIEADGVVELKIVKVGATVVNFWSTSILAINTWYHLAYVENGDSYKIYVNGVAWASATDTDRPGTYIGNIHIGADPDATPTVDDLNGYLDEFRVSKTARWTADFTPPSAEYAVSGASAGRGRWSKAPDGCIAYCNGVDTMVWGGDEYRVASFINFDPDASFKYDYTEAVTNTLTDSVNTAFLKTVAGGGNDSNAVLLLNANSDFTDSASGSAPAKVVTASGAVINTSTKKFGAGSIYFDGSNDYCSTPDHADFDFSDGTWTIDFWIYNNADTGGRIFHQQTDANNNIRLYNTNDTLYLRIMSGGTDVVSISCPPGSLPNSAWHHVALVENGDSYKIYMDGVEKGTTTDTDRPANYTGVFYIGSAQGTSNFLSAYIDEFRVSKTARWTADFTPPTSAYSTSAGVTHVYVGSVRPIRGAKFYELTANTAAATATAFYWDGSAWASVTNLTDGTALSGKTLAQTGSITFDDTKSLAKTSILYANQFYWYYFKFDGIDNNTAIYYTTLDCSFQAIKDIWDATERNCLSFKLLKTTLEDYTLQIATDDYDENASHTFVNLGAMTSSQYGYAGFDNPVTALYFYIAGGKENTNTATISIDYWNGTAWTSVGTVQDATLSSGKTLGRTGIVSWNALTAGTEFTTSLTNEINFYYYRIGVSATLSANCYLYYLTAIPTQKQIGQYKFPVLWQNRLWLCSNQGGKKNWIRGGSYGTVCVFNGSDSVELFFGGDEEVTAAAPLFTRFGGSVYDILIITKRNETYLVDGSSPEDYKVYMVAPNYGCPAPETLRICDMGVETSFGSNKHVAVWQSSNAIIIFDGNTIIPISDDISNFFDPADSRCINSSMVHRSIGFYNKNKREYTWCFASGSSTSLNEEWVYRFRESKWYEVDRGSKDLQLGINVIDTNGNDFIYGAIDTGYLERLENGTSWDGSDMTYNFRTSDMSFNGVMYETSIRFLKLVGKAKNITANDISIAHYLNGSSTATTPSITAISPDSSNRIFQVVRSLNSGKGTYHSLDFSITTNNETIGFEPLRLGLMVKVEREDIK